ncbi:MAG: alpha-ketoglutarate-dependent dioxygenase AlkB [Deltaproteobacteria bacterium]|nr:alpha-ketoglutarate-dependent dioxygenase AlkB [Deltaproteobacteria bacterium]
MGDPVPSFAAVPTWTRALPLGGWLACWERWLDATEAARAYDALYREVEWSERTIVIAGREVKQPRLVAWYGDAHAVYTYSGRRNEPQPWNAALSAVRDRLVETVGVRFDSVLANLYRNGEDAMGMHADREPELGPEPLIASVSLGATRRFVLRPRDRRERRGELVETLRLEDGMLLLLGGATQDRYKHGVPRESAPTGPRINLTFRQIRLPSGAATPSR